MTLIELIYTD